MSGWYQRVGRTVWVSGSVDVKTTWDGDASQTIPSKYARAYVTCFNPLPFQERRNDTWRVLNPLVATLSAFNDYTNGALQPSIGMRAYEIDNKVRINVDAPPANVGFGHLHVSFAINYALQE